MGRQYDLSQFLVDPNRFAFDSAASQVSDEFMTEMVVAGLPVNFSAARSCDSYDDIMDDVDPDYPPHLFMVVTDKGRSNLLITFRDAVEINVVRESIRAVVREEISRCGYDGATYKYGTCPLTEGVFDIIHHYYEHGFDGPK